MTRAILVKDGCNNMSQHDPMIVLRDLIAAAVAMMPSGYRVAIMVANEQGETSFGMSPGLEAEDVAEVFCGGGPSHFEVFQRPQ